MMHWYRIQKIRGQGGFGITDLAQDTNLNRQVALKGYLPIEVAVREDDRSVHPVSENHSETFTWGLDRFVQEARTLARFDHPNIVRVLSVFEMNNTAYMVMRHESGRSLQQMLAKGATLAETRLNEVIFPILEGLERVHAAGFIHRDVKPANILIREDGIPMLLDFGSARQSLGDTTRTFTTLVSPGYAAFEQYFSKSDRQGPWTNIYGLGATFYRAMSGGQPMNAVDRSEGVVKRGRDPLTPAATAAAGRYSSHLLDAIDWAVRFREDSRPQNIAEWRQALEGNSALQPPEAARVETLTPAAMPSSEQRRIAGLLEQAGADIDQLRLSTPPGNNALENYRQVLALDEKNQQAKYGVRRIVETSVQLGRQRSARITTAPAFSSTRRWQSRPIPKR
jgi:serine/threonine protein kinase